MKFITISKSLQGYHIYMGIPGTCSREHMHLIGYSKRNAIKAFRQAYGLEHKHLTILEV